jgi:hypothetical protein
VPGIPARGAADLSTEEVRRADAARPFRRAQPSTGGETNVSKTLSIRSLIVLPLLAFAAFLLVAVDAGALAQNSNSSTTHDDHATTTGGNTAPSRTRRSNRRRRTRPRPVVVAPDAPDAPDANVSADQDANLSASELAGGVDADLSGTYSGPLSLTGGHEMSGDATLTITGNQFTLESGGMTHTGRVLAVTTRGYTGVSLYFTDVTDATTNTPLAVSVRARRRGDQLTLEPVPGARNVMRFGQPGRRAGGRRGR